MVKPFYFEQELLYLQNILPVEKDRSTEWCVLHLMKNIIPQTVYFKIQARRTNLHVELLLLPNLIIYLFLSVLFFFFCNGLNLDVLQWRTVQYEQVRCLSPLNCLSFIIGCKVEQLRANCLNYFDF